MKKILISILAAAVGMAAQAQSDTLRLSSLYTTHIIFPSELSYVDVSNKAITAKVVDNSKNILAIKARYKFDYCTTISALESDGRMSTYIVVYDESPKELVIDRRIDERKADKATTASDSKESKTPQAQEILKQRRKLFHLSDSKYKMTVACEDIFVCNDITYFVLSVENKSGISYDCADAGFVIESRKNSKRSLDYKKVLNPQSRAGSLSTGPHQTSKVVYSMDKVTLTSGQMLNLYFYENGGSRNLILHLMAKDLNDARTYL